MSQNAEVNTVVMNANESARYALHDLSVKLTDDVGFEVQCIQSSKSTGFVGKRLKVREISVSDVVSKMSAAPLGSIASAVREFISAQQRALIKQLILNGASSVGENQIDLDAIGKYLESSGVTRLTKELLVRVFDEILSTALCALIAESRNLTESLNESEILAVCAPSLKAYRALFLELNKKVDDVVIDPSKAEQMKKVISFAVRSEMLNQSVLSGNAICTADMLISAIDSRTVEVAEF